MLHAIEALNYRCLRYVRTELGPYRILVGPNASGKTTFLDVVAFLGRLVSSDLEAALDERSTNFEDLLWNRDGDAFELAIEVVIPRALQEVLGDRSSDRIRYQVKIGIDRTTNERGILAETAILLDPEPAKPEEQRRLFPDLPPLPSSIMAEKKSGRRTVVNKVSGGNDNFYSEVHKKGGKGWAPSFKLGPRKSALGNLPEDESKFPVSTWLKQLLTDGITQLVLNSQLIRKASPPGQGFGFRPDGSNLPWVVDRLRRNAPERHRDWLRHIQTALPDITDIDTIERADDKHRYLMVIYEGGLRVPSWTLSDGTLRFLALTLPAYLPDLRGVFLIEEPENGIHPRAIEALSHSLSSVYDAQILVATHSPIILAAAEARNVLCFKKTDAGETDIVAGDRHPALADWKGEVNLGELFAAGVLG